MPPSGVDMERPDTPGATSLLVPPPPFEVSAILLAAYS